MCYQIFRKRVYLSAHVLLLVLVIIQGTKLRKKNSEFRHSSKANVTSLTKAMTREVSVKVIRHLFQLIDDLETKEPIPNPRRNYFVDGADDRLTLWTQNWYFFYKFDMYNKDTKDVVIRIMQQMMYKCRVSLDELDALTKQYSTHRSYRMGILFSKLTQLKLDMLAIYSMMRNNEEARFTSILTLYQHLLRKYFDTVYMIEYLMNQHLEYVKDAIELYESYTKAAKIQEESGKPPSTYSPEEYQDYVEKQEAADKQHEEENQKAEESMKEPNATTTEAPTTTTTTLTTKSKKWRTKSTPTTTQTTTESTESTESTTESTTTTTNDPDGFQTEEPPVPPEPPEPPGDPELDSLPEPPVIEEATTTIATTTTVPMEEWEFYYSDEELPEKTEATPEP